MSWDLDATEAQREAVKRLSADLHREHGDPETSGWGFELEQDGDAISVWVHLRTGEGTRYRLTATGDLVPATCHWLIQVASGNPEPDFPEDLWTEVECGAELTVNEYGSWRCTAGHEYVTYDDPARRAYDAEQAFLERQEEGY